MNVRFTSHPPLWRQSRVFRIVVEGGLLLGFLVCSSWLLRR